MFGNANSHSSKSYTRLIVIMLLLGCIQLPAKGQGNAEYTLAHGAIIRGDQTKKQLALIFTGHEYGEGGAFIARTLEDFGIKASFFFTGDFYRHPGFQSIIQTLIAQGNYLGAHSDKHLLYCDWENRDSLVIDRKTFKEDLDDNYREMAKRGIAKEKANYFLPPFEWYNDTISQWAMELGLQLINFSPGTRSNADYTDPQMENYVDNEAILKSILDYERAQNLNGFMLLIHIGVGPKRKEKFYRELPKLIRLLKAKGYRFVTVDQLLNPNK